MSQVLGAFGLLDFTTSRYGPFPLGARFETYDPFISLIFQIFFRAAVGGPPVFVNCDWVDTR
jgi:hypothetical protein